MKKMKNRPQIARGGKGNGSESLVDFMRVSMDKNEENEKSSSDCTRWKREWDGKSRQLYESFYGRK